MKRITSAMKRVVNNAYAFAVLTKIVSVFLVLLYSIIYSRYMKPELKGVGDVINNYAEFGKMIICMGMYHAYPYYKKEKGKDLYKEFINIISGVFLLYLGIAIVVSIVIRPQYNILTVIFLLPMLYLMTQFNYIVLVENPKIRNKTQVLLDLGDIIFILALHICFNASLTILIIYILIRQLFHTIVSIMNLRISIFEIRPTLKGALNYVRYGMMPMVTMLLMEVNYKADVIMMDRMGIPNSIIGIYSLGLVLAQKIWLIPDTLKDILLSKLVNGKGKDEVAKVTRINIAVVAVFVIGVILLGRPVIFFLYGNDYEGAYYVILILLVGIIGMVFYKTIYSFNVVNGKRKENLLFLGMAAFINIIINFLLIPKFNMYGAAFASTSSYFVCGICFLIEFSMKNKVRIRDMILIQKKDLALFKSIIR